MYGFKLPSRNLNDNGFILGLTFLDFVFGLMLFALVSRFLEHTKLAALSFGVAILFWLILIPIRLKYRKKIIRDSITAVISGGQIK